MDAWYVVSNLFQNNMEGDKRKALCYSMHYIFHNTNCLEFSFFNFLSYCLQSLQTCSSFAWMHLSSTPTPWHTLPVPASGTCLSREQRLTCETDLTVHEISALVEYSGVKSSTGKKFLKVEGEINSVLKRIKNWELHLHPTISQVLWFSAHMTRETTKIHGFMLYLLLEISFPSPLHLLSNYLLKLHLRLWSTVSFPLWYSLNSVCLP